MPSKAHSVVRGTTPMPSTIFARLGKRTTFEILYVSCVSKITVSTNSTVPVLVTRKVKCESCSMRSMLYGFRWHCYHFYGITSHEQIVIWRVIFFYYVDLNVVIELYTHTHPHSLEHSRLVRYQGSTLLKVFPSPHLVRTPTEHSMSFQARDYRLQFYRS